MRGKSRLSPILSSVRDSTPTETQPRAALFLEVHYFKVHLLGTLYTIFEGLRGKIEVESHSWFSPIRGWVPVGVESIQGWVPVGVESIRGWVLFGVESIRGSVHLEFSPIRGSVPFRVGSIRGSVHSGFSPFGVGSIRGGVHSRFSPFEVQSIRGWVFLGSVFLGSVVLGSVGESKKQPSQSGFCLWIWSQITQLIHVHYITYLTWPWNVIVLTTLALDFFFLSSWFYGHRDACVEKTTFLS